MKKIAIVLLLLWPTSALTQSVPNLYQGFVPSAAQWKSYFAQKWDYPGYTALNKSGDTMLGLFGVARYSIGTLPSCSSVFIGTLAYVTDGVASPSYRDAVSTTGSTAQLVFCNGSGWTYR
jgi:hypothetical protein